MKIHGTRTQGSPRRLAVFLEEKRLDIPFVPVDLRKGEHRTPDFLAKNPLALVPVLELAEPRFLGRDPLERARFDMWARRVEFGFYDAIRAFFRHGSPHARALEPVQIAEWSELGRRRAGDALRVLDHQLADNEFIAGPDFSWADITLVTSLEGTAGLGFEIPADCRHVQRWLEKASRRASVVSTRPA